MRGGTEARRWNVYLGNDGTGSEVVWQDLKDGSDSSGVVKVKDSQITRPPIRGFNVCA